MKKFVIGLLVGIGLAFAFNAQAEIKSFVGATIEGQFPVTVDGETIETPSIVVEGMSYLPVRTIAEQAGYDVHFDSKSGIHLIKINVPEVTEFSEDEVVELPEATDEKLEERIRSIGASIEMMQVSLLVVEERLANTTDEEKRQELNEQIEKHLQEIQNLEAEKAALEAQLNAGQ